MKRPAIDTKPALQYVRPKRVFETKELVRYRSMKSGRIRNSTIVERQGYPNKNRQPFWRCEKYEYNGTKSVRAKNELFFK